MKLIYIAGPYRPYTCADGTWVGTPMNIRNAEVTAVNLVNALGRYGLFPVVPHLNTRDFENQVEQNDDQYFLDGTMAMLERCDAVLLTMPNADEVSSGTKAEVHRAHQRGIQVYRSFDSLRRAAQENQIVRLPVYMYGCAGLGVSFLHNVRDEKGDGQRDRGTATRRVHAAASGSSKGLGRPWPADGSGLLQTRRPCTVHAGEFT